MRFESVRIARCGRLRDVATPDPLPSLVVVLGPNESGKTTFFSFLRELVQGFQPASRDRHPYAPWEGGDIEGEARISLDDGTVLGIHRRLTSTGRGVLSQGGVDEDIRNQPLPAAGHVSRALFRQVYWLNLFELARLEDESWHIVQDRLVAALGIKGLRPAREVADGLEAQANRLWRPDRRGRPLARKLQDELARLGDRRRDALKTDAEVRDRATALADKRAEQEEVRGRQERERTRRAEIEQAIEDRRTRLEGLRAELRGADDRLDGLEREAAACRDAVDAYRGGPHWGIADAEARLRSAAAARDSLPDMDAEVAAARRRVDEMRARMEEHGEALLAVPAGEVDAETLAAVDLKRLRRRVREQGTARTRLEREREDDGDPGRPLMRLPGAMKPGPRRLVWGWTLLGVGAAIGAVRLFVPGVLSPLASDPMTTSAVAVGGAVLLGIAGLILLVMQADAARRYRQYRRVVAAAERRRAEHLKSLERLERAAREAVKEALGGLPVLQTLLDAPSAELPSAIDQARELLDRIGERQEALGARRAELAGAREEIRRTREWTAATLGIATGDVSLSDALDAALREREVARAASSRLERIAGRRAEAEQEREAARWELDRFEKEDQGSLGTELNASDARQEELVRRAEEIAGDTAALEAEMRHLRAAETVAEVTGRIAVVRARLQEAREDRDRAFVLARLVREAYRRFREANQPELLRRAGGYLRQITRGRYDRIEMSGVDETVLGAGGRPGQEHLMIRSAVSGQSVAVGETTSQGTREQVYLAMRLAIVDHLDAGHERLPVFLDETLVNWDAWRRDGAFDLLEDLTATRQVFVFTCHPAMAAELEDRGGTIIPMDAAAAAPEQSS